MLGAVVVGRRRSVRVAVVLVSVAAAVVTRRHAVRRLGGVTGDVIGAAIEIALAAGLVTAALVVTALPHP